MGNCCRRESATVWATVDECYDEPSPRKHPPMEKECPLGADSIAPTPLHDQVRIKITKRELEELLASARVHDMPVDRVFSQLINGVNQSHVLRQRSWEPSLHSIAE